MGGAFTAEKDHGFATFYNPAWAAFLVDRQVGLSYSSMSLDRRLSGLSFATPLPPTAGFVGKFYIFSALIKGGESFYWLAIAGGINSVISLYYYLRVVKVMYFEGERNDSILNPSGIVTGMLLATSIPSLLFGIYWAPVANWIENSLVFFIQTI